MSIRYDELFFNSIDTYRLNAYKFKILLDTDFIVDYEIPISVQRNYAFEPMIYLVEHKRVANCPITYITELNDNIPYIIESSIKTQKSGLTFTASTADDFYFVFSSSEKPVNKLTANNDEKTKKVVLIVLLAENIDGQTALCYGGDFGDRPNDCDFCCNGVIFADRKKSELSSKAQEMKYHYQPVSFEIDESLITVSNNNLFVATDGLKFIFEVVHNGKTILKDEFSLSVPAGESQKITVANAKPEYGETLYKISVVRHKTEIAFEEKVIGRLPEKAVPCGNAPKVIEGHFNIGVTANGVSYLFTKSGTSYKVAGLVSICVGGEEWLKREPLPTIFRPNTTNDCCNAFRYEAAAALGFSYNVRCDQPSVKWKVENDKFIIRYRYIFDNARNEGAAVEYVIDGSGKMRVNATLEKLSAIPSLPLFGIKFEFPLNKDRFKYFGKGPYDCYPDRKKGIQSGIYSSNAAREYVDYIYPQECGNHEDTRWIEIFGENSSLTFKSDKNFSFKFLQYDDISIERATHKEDLPEPRSNYLTVCGFTRSVGGDDSWGAKVHPEFELPATGGYRYSFDIIPKKCMGEK